MRTKLPFCICLLLGLIVLTIDTDFLASIGIGHYGRIVIFFLIMLIAFISSFRTFQKAGRAAIKPGEAQGELLKQLEREKEGR